MNLNNVLIFVGGAAIGATVTYFILKEKTQKMVDEAISDAINNSEYLNSVAARVDTLTADFVQLSADAQAPTDEKPEVETDKGEKLTKKPVSYDKIAEKYNATPDDVVLFEETEEFKNMGPYMISEGQFENEMPEFNKVDVTLFSDLVLMIEDDDELVNLDEAIGMRLVEQFNEHPETTVLFVRNELQCTDYQIFREETTYIEFLGD